MQKVKKSCRKLAQKLSCIDTPYEEPPFLARSRGTSSASLRTPAASSQTMTQGATSTVRTPPHHSAGKDPTTEDDDDDDNDPRAFADSTTSGTLGSRTRSAYLS